MSRFEKFQKTRILYENIPIDEPIYLGSECSCIINFENGYISNRKNKTGKKLPAIECGDTHIEYWENGVLHKNDGPAVILAYIDSIEYWENGEKKKKKEKEPFNNIEKMYEKIVEEKKRKGKNAEQDFAEFLNKKNIPFIHLDQPSGELYSKILKEKNIKRPDYIVFIDKKPLFVDVKATDCYLLSKEELKKFSALENEFSINIIFAITDINENKYKNFSFLTLANMNNYVEKIKTKIEDSKNWELFPVPNALLKEEMAHNKIDNEELSKIFYKEKEAYIKNKYRFSDILEEYLKKRKYIIEKDKT